ncbi:hypothetical protein LBMAG42_39760 [Deltaproteobacteria bacterium]|nr:hypothetical protein LBMAG42_39760 [Deltaproteobacteria bacterium]
MRFVYALLPMLLVACPEGVKDTSEQLGTQDQSLSFWPPEAGRGTTFDAKITSTNSVFDFDGNDLSLGGGVTVNSFTVLDGWTATANVTVDPAATLGARDADVTTRGGDFEIGSALTIVDDSFALAPSRAKIGEHIQVELIGQNTEWVSGKTWTGFGEGVEVNAVDVLSETYMLADVTVSPDAIPGLRDVYVENGSDLTTGYNAFQVDRVGISASFDPAEVTQGQTVSFTIVGKDTHFSKKTDIRFFQYGDEKGDIVIDSITVLDGENMYGQLTVSNAAELGTRDILIATDDEGVFVEDGTTVLDADIDIGDVGISRWFYVARSIDNASGAISEYVSVGAIFYLPLDPPCPPNPESNCTDKLDNDSDDYTDCNDSDCSTDPACGGGPQPYDSNGVWQTYTTGGSADCPANETVSAGDHVWLESDCNIVTLDKHVDGASGMIYYSKDDVALPDYCFDQMYALHTEGDPEGIPEETVEDAQPTVPADYEMLVPGWWGNYTHSRAEDLTYTWTPAQTYPDAFFGTQISGALVDPEGAQGYAGSLPWDDGEHTYTPDELGQLKEGNASFTAFSYIEGPPVGFTFSTVTTKSSSTVQVSGSLVLE